MKIVHFFIGMECRKFEVCDVPRIGHLVTFYDYQKNNVQKIARNFIVASVEHKFVFDDVYKVNESRIEIILKEIFKCPM